MCVGERVTDSRDFPRSEEVDLGVLNGGHMVFRVIWGHVPGATMKRVTSSSSATCTFSVWLWNYIHTFTGGESFLFFRSQVRQTNVEEQITECPSAKKSVALRSLEQSSKRTRIEAELWLFSFLNKLSSFDCLNHVAECWTFGHLHLMVCCVIGQGIAKCASGF